MIYISVKENTDLKMMEILRILRLEQEPIGAKIIADKLTKRGYELGERAVRYHMRILDEKGFTEKIGYSGRKITKKGEKELEKGLIYDQVNFVYSMFEERMYETTFNPKTKKGSVIVNISSIDKNAKPIIKKTFEKGLAVSPCIKTLHKNNTEYIQTICGTTIDGVLQKSGIISQPKFGGLLKVEDYIPQRFIEQIAYKESSITPLEAFTGKNMTSVLDIMDHGEGILPANFRIVPEAKKEEVSQILNMLKQANINGVLKVGKPGQSVLGMPVEENMIGIVIIGGITPLCAAAESGFNLDIKVADIYSEYNTMTNIIEKQENILKNTTDKQQPLVNYVLNKAYNLMSQVDFDIENNKGNIIANISYINNKDIDKSIEILDEFYKNNQEYCVGNKYLILPGKNEDTTGIATVCSLTINGIFMNNGIISKPEHSGILEIDPKQKRFIELISYTGSSVDPHEIFLAKNMTATNNLNENYGKILASVHSIPDIAQDKSLELFKKIECAGFKPLKIEKPNKLVYNAKVDPYHFGIVTPGGLNPLANLIEKGINMEIKSVEKLMDYNKFKKI